MALKSVLRTAAVLALALALGRTAAADEAPRDVVERFNETLITAMRNADGLGFEGRSNLLHPVLTEIFDFEAMARFAVGPRHWQTFSRSQRRELVDTFARLSVATFAARFDGWSGETFVVGGQQPGPRGAVLVRNRLLRPNRTPVDIDLVLVPDGDGWHVVDVLLDGTFSELALRRAEYVEVLAAGGFDSLMAEIESSIARRRAG